MLKQNSLVILLAFACLSLVFISMPNYASATSYDVVSPSVLTGKKICGVARINNIIGMQSPDDASFYMFNASNFALLYQKNYVDGIGCNNVLTYKNTFIFTADKTIQELETNLPFPTTTAMPNPCIGSYPSYSSELNFAYTTSDTAKDINFVCVNSDIVQIRADNPVVEEYLPHSVSFSHGCGKAYAWVHDEINGYAVLTCLLGGSTGQTYLWNNTAESNSFVFDNSCCNQGVLRQYNIAGVSREGNYYAGFQDGGQIQVIKRVGSTISTNGTLLSNGRDYPIMCQTTHAPYSNCGADTVVSISQIGLALQVFTTINGSMVADISCGLDCPLLGYLGGSTVSNDTFYSSSGIKGSFIVFHAKPFTGKGNGTCDSSACPGSNPPPSSGGTGSNGTCPTTPVDFLNNQGTVLNAFENWWVQLNIVSCNNTNPQTNGFGLLFLLAFLILELFFFMLITRGQLEKIHVAFWIVGLFIAIGITTYLGLIEPYWMILLIVILALFGSYRIWYPMLTGKSSSVGIGGD